MPAVDLSNRVAAVTGASLGIGAATAVALGRAGAKVAVNYRSNGEKANEVVQAIEDAGSQAFAFQADVSDLQAVEALVAAAVDRYGQLDIAISNAAYSDREPFYEADLGGELTAVASAPISGDDRRLFRRFNLINPAESVCADLEGVVS